jgi:hypothetical protein
MARTKAPAGKEYRADKQRKKDEQKRSDVPDLPIKIHKRRQKTKLSKVSDGNERIELTDTATQQPAKKRALDDEDAVPSKKNKCVAPRDFASSHSLPAFAQDLSIEGEPIEYAQFFSLTRCVFGARFVDLRETSS